MLHSHDTVVACSIVTYELIRFRPSSNTPFAFEIPALLLTFGEKETEMAETIIALIIERRRRAVVDRRQIPGK